MIDWVDQISPERKAFIIEKHIVSTLATYRETHRSKILGVGVTAELADEVPNLCTQLWAVLDTVPTVFTGATMIGAQKGEDVDELADLVARKCLTLFGPTKQPRLSINHRNEVQVDVAGQCQITTLSDYEKTVRPTTWRAVNYWISRIKEQNLRFAFFSATPQGGGVALSRHALLRFLRIQGVRVEWYVPKPRPEVFRLTKTNHNILQGAATPDIRATDEQLRSLSTWIRENAERYWLSANGPLKKRSENGADVIIVEDPQMPELVKISKSVDPDRPVIFRSHIEIRDDLVRQKGSAAHHVWETLWESIRLADVFISHPVRSFVPHDVKPASVGWLPATSDWLDGLNKTMDEWDIQYYLHELRDSCHDQGVPALEYPRRPYIAQIARFDPSKGIPEVVRSYGKLRRQYMKEEAIEKQPQLIICGDGSIDDPDGAKSYDQTIELISREFPELKKDIVVIRFGPIDQMPNAILSKASVVLQLSSREGFEVKVSEALRKGKPVIATNTGGIPLQIEHGKSGFLVPRGDIEAVAKYLHGLFTDEELYSRMSNYATNHISDEVHTVGNALAWTYLVAAVAADREFQPNQRWINDLAREGAGVPYTEDEPRLPRHLST
ncbi:uncharacterized protein A1O5_12136 [Cladophialophora psammophila CBS 110553]|uniref:Uncharacterized protein n=1 Tax=Cladophialophora psammophila CBS 110553 TaxID=1182543 RepID=W9W4Q0_9EURO|nr:uncharacterized protein A1O5_12136 [Cladophialophora psammophila CBS 110553]EXJ59511.1 hypothetical protein A1O5_12136 [Cladophialophora psammophila CBS 110553]